MKKMISIKRRRIGANTNNYIYGKGRSDSNINMIIIN